MSAGWAREITELNCECEGEDIFGARGRHTGARLALRSGRGWSRANASWSPISHPPDGSMGRSSKKNPAGAGAKPEGGKAPSQRPPLPPGIRKVPSLDGKFKGDPAASSKAVVAHAGASFLRAPSPRHLPLPPARWKPRRADSAGAPPPAPPASNTGAGLQRAAGVRRQLQGNLLYLTLSARFPAELYSDLAGKITGMLLEGLDAGEVADVLSDKATRDGYVDEALALLQESGDERAVRALAAPAPPPPPPLPRRPMLQVDVRAAHEAQAAETGATSGLTPGLGGLGLRMSPRVSTNKYQTSNILAVPVTR